MSCSFKCHCGNDLVDDNSTRKGHCYDCNGKRGECTMIDCLAAPVKVAEPEKPKTVPTFPCWYCQKPIPMEGECSHDDAFSQEFDTPVHRSCVKAKLKQDPTCQEALLIAGDVLSFRDGVKFGKKPGDDAREELWSILQGYGHKYQERFPYNCADLHFNKFPMEDEDEQSLPEDEEKRD